MFACTPSDAGLATFASCADRTPAIAIAAIAVTAARRELCMTTSCERAAGRAGVSARPAAARATG